MGKRGATRVPRPDLSFLRERSRRKPQANRPSSCRAKEKRSLRRQPRAPNKGSTRTEARPNPQPRELRVRAPECFRTMRRTQHSLLIALPSPRKQGEREIESKRNQRTSKASESG
jgi:hypothetical protein